MYKFALLSTIDSMIEVVGLIAASFTTFSFLPQALSILKTKHTKDISLPMYIVLTTGIFLWFVYGISIISWPVILANAVSFVLTLTILILKLRYG